jgi:hypothetical protein
MSFSKVFEKLIYARLYNIDVQTTYLSMNNMGLETTILIYQFRSC